MVKDNIEVFMYIIVNGETHWICVADYSRQDIIQWMELLKTQYHNGSDYRLLKLWHTDFPSIQGPWTPFTFKDPSLNQVKFPDVNMKASPTYMFCYYTYMYILFIFRKRLVKLLN